MRVSVAFAEFNRTQSSDSVCDGVAKGQKDEKCP